MEHNRYIGVEQFEEYKQYIYAGKIEEAKKLLLEIIPRDCMIYKYFPGINRDWNTITKPELWLSRAINFNDPFDCAFLYNCHSKEKYDQKTEMALAIEENLKQYVRDKESDRLQKSLFVGCFSERKDSLLMWGHYGDDHRGICVGYNLYDLIERYNCFPVIYNDEMPQMENVDLNKPELAMKSILTKCSDWSYENEWRVIEIDFSSVGDELPGKPVPFEKPLEVYIGARIDDKYRRNHKKYAKLKKEDGAITVEEALSRDDFYIDANRITKYREQEKNLQIYSFEMERGRFELFSRRWPKSI